MSAPELKGALHDPDFGISAVDGNPPKSSPALDRDQGEANTDEMQPYAFDVLALDGDDLQKLPQEPEVAGNLLPRCTVHEPEPRR